MDKCLLKVLVAASLVVLLSILLAACGGGDRQDGEQGAPETLDGQTLVEERCTECHGLDRVTAVSQTREEWEATVEDMVSKGADLNAQEQEAVIEYLSTTYSD
jgi:hypothetical protein